MSKDSRQLLLEDKNPAHDRRLDVDDTPAVSDKPAEADRRLVVAAAADNAQPPADSTTTVQTTPADDDEQQQQQQVGEKSAETTGQHVGMLIDSAIAAVQTWNIKVKPIDVSLFAGLSVAIFLAFTLLFGFFACHPA